jgi:hypothetical protein
MQNTNESDSIAVDHTVEFERLRRYWLEGRRGWGLMTFIQQGMVAWVKYSCTAETQGDTTEFVDADLEACENAQSSSYTYGNDLQHQLTNELTNLILHCRQEVVA